MVINNNKHSIMIMKNETLIINFSFMIQCSVPLSYRFAARMKLPEIPYDSLRTAQSEPNPTMLIVHK